MNHYYTIILLLLPFLFFLLSCQRVIQRSLLLLLLCLSTQWALATPSFTVQKIEAQGLVRVSQQTLLSYLPIHVGDKLTDASSNRALNVLYATGFFSNVTLLGSGNTLIVKVDERPIISSITVLGNKELPKDKLDEALKKMGFAEGEVFNKAILEQVKDALIEQYNAMGRYSATVKETITEEPRHRIAITLNVSEGMSPRVVKVSVLGNKAFSESTLLSQLTLAPTNMLSMFTSKDEYSKEKLDKSLEALQSYYLDRGYLDVRVDSSKVTLTPDKKQVYIVFHVVEGEPYDVKEVNFSGKLILPESEFVKSALVKKGDLFSRQKILDTNKIITTKLGDEGYAFAKVNIKPNVDAAQHLVALDFEIDPGNLYYVRHIRFIGNTATSNIALRNMLTQFEGARYSASKIDQSTRNLRQLPYLKAPEMEVTPIPVAGSSDQVDLEIKVVEQSSAQFQFGVGYSQAFGALISSGVTQNNFLGTGKSLGTNVSLNQFQQSYSVNYTNPFFTYDGVSRSSSFSFQNVDPGAVLGANNPGYAVSAFTLSDMFGFPLTNYQQFTLGYSLQASNLLVGGSAAKEVRAFQSMYGAQFYQAIFSTGWNYSTFDRLQFPTQGVRQNLNFSVSTPISTGNGLQYFSTSYQNRFYQPLTSGFIFNTNWVTAYGDGYGQYPSLPLLQNYYAGGIGTLAQNRAYTPNSLGPLSSIGQPIGGNLLLSGTVAMIVPTVLEKYNVRTNVFLDGGNVFNTEASPYAAPYGISAANLRYSYGVQIEWWTPIGMPLVFSFAKPFNNQQSDQTLFFQFNIGSGF